MSPVDHQTVKDRGSGLAAVLGSGATTALLSVSSDIVLVLDHEGVIRGVTASPPLAGDEVSGWRGRPLAALVTVEGKPKITEIVADALAGAAPRWRQVTHALASGEVPVRYAGVADGDRIVVVGRDMRSVAATQQRLLQAQQSLERDYLRLRQTEARYRMLFDLPGEATLIVDTSNWRIVEANAGMHALLGLAPGALVRQPVGAVADAAMREPFLAYLGAAATAAKPAGGSLTLRSGSTVSITAAPFRQERSTFLLVRAATDAGGASPKLEGGLRRVVEAMPDAFVLTGRSLTIVAANAAFLDMVQAPGANAVVGEPLGAWLGRPGVDMELVVAELRKSGAIRNVATVVRGRHGGQEEVELSAVLVEADGEEHLGFVLRGVARRLRDLPPTERELPRTVDQLTELVGRLSLKEIVRESTDLIERLCIEAALTYTADNRASAAELLGLSRQGLYTKLHRHGIGGLVTDE